MTKTRSNVLHRPYDRAFPDDMRDAVQERRRAPTGFEHEVKIARRGDDEIQCYPWKELELGDFFLARVSGNEKSLRIAFYQAAARHDYEIAILPVERDGLPFLRVTLVVIGVNKYKAAAEKQGAKGIRYSDGKWNKRRNRWRKSRADTRQPPKPKPAPKPKWQDDDAPLAIDLAIQEAAPPPDVHLSRAEMLKRALAKAGEG